MTNGNAFEPCRQNLLGFMGLFIGAILLCGLLAALMGSKPGEIAGALASLLAGVLALTAGLLAYHVGRQQVEAVEKQNFQLRVSERRRLARDGIFAARLFDGIILNVARNIEAIDTFGNDPNNTIGDSETNRIRQKLKALPLYEVIEQLGKLNREAIDNYFWLCSSIDDFRIKTAAENAAALKTELNGIRNLVSFLRNEVAGDAKKAEDVLFETQGSVSDV